MQYTFDLLNVDHIIPSALIETLGLRWEAGYQDVENLELLCRRCNIIKGSRLNFNHLMTFPLLPKYVELSASLYSVAR